MGRNLAEHPSNAIAMTRSLTLPEESSFGATQKAAITPWQCSFDAASGAEARVLTQLRKRSQE